MTIKVKFDPILGRLREKDGDGGDTPTPTPVFTVTTIGDNKTYYADQKQTDTLTVVAECRYDDNLVDVANPPQGWERASLGTYSKTISGTGTVGATTFTYTPEGGSPLSAKTTAKTLTKKWPAYWGTYPSGVLPEGRIDTIAANLASQHRATANVVNSVVNVLDDPNQDVWLWVVTHGSATVVDNTLGANIMNSPDNVADFASPMQGANFDLSGYKVYISTWPAEAGQGGFGELKINITL